MTSLLVISNVTTVASLFLGLYHFPGLCPHRPELNLLLYQESIVEHLYDVTLACHCR